MADLRASACCGGDGVELRPYRSSFPIDPARLERYFTWAVVAGFAWLLLIPWLSEQAERAQERRQRWPRLP